MRNAMVFVLWCRCGGPMILSRILFIVRTESKAVSLGFHSQIKGPVFFLKN